MSRNRHIVRASCALVMVLSGALVVAGCGGGGDGRMAEPVPPEVQQKQMDTINKEYKNFYKDQAKQHKKGRS